MKKFYVLIAIGTLAFFAGCNQQKNDVATVSPLDQVSSNKEVMISLNEQGSTAANPVDNTVASSATTQEIPSEGLAATTTTPTNQQIQQALKNTGLYQGSIDATLGKKSKKAIKEFQEQNGLTADGKVGKKTWAKLEPYLNAPSVSTPTTEQVNQ